MKLFKKIKKDKSEAPSMLHRSRSATPLRAQTFSHHSARDRDPARVASRGEKKPEAISGSRLERGMLMFAILLAVGCIGYVLWLDSTPRIRFGEPARQVDALLLRDEQYYQNGIRDILSSSLANHSKLFINSNTVSRDILEAFPELRSAVVTIPLMSHSPVVSISPREPVLKLQVGSALYVVDRDGYVLVAVDDIPSEARQRLESLPLVVDATADTADVGTQLLTAQSVQFTLDVIHALDSHSPININFPRDSVNELRISLKDKSYYVKFDITGDARKQTGSLLATLEYVEKQGRAVNEYIDVRVDGKVFFK